MNDAQIEAQIEARSRPIVSVIMPSYNAESTLAASIRSIQAQDFTEWELIVVDDRSTDSSVTLVQKQAAQDPRIRLIALDVNGGVAQARNHGLKAARGRYIAFLDSDDYWLPAKLGAQLRELSNGAQVVHTGYFRLLPDGALSTVHAAARVSPWHFYLFNPIGNLTGIYDRDVLGLFLQERVRHEDYLMWFQIVRQAGSSAGVQEPLAVYRVSSSSLSGQKLRAAMWHWDLLRKHMRVSLVVASAGFIAYACRSVVMRLVERLPRWRRMRIGIPSRRGAG
jgi:teichuronic acid biosynthesis glycosyltransferase TuaG